MHYYKYFISFQAEGKRIENTDVIISKKIDRLLDIKAIEKKLSELKGYNEIKVIHYNLLKKIDVGKRDIPKLF